MNELWSLLGGEEAITLVIISVALFVLCTILPIMGIIWAIYRRKRQVDTVRQATQTWVTTTGEVIQSQVEIVGGEAKSLRPKVRYQYKVGGQLYENDQVRAGDKFMLIMTSQQAHQTVERYPTGASVNIFYNPDNPAESALEK